MFITVESSADYCRRMYGINIRMGDVRALIDVGLLPVFGSKSSQTDTREAKMILKGDFESLLPILSTMADSEGNSFLGRSLFDGGIPARLSITTATYVDFPGQPREVPPVFYAAARNLILMTQNGRENQYKIETNGKCLEGNAHTIGCESSQPTSSVYFSPTRITTSSPNALRYIKIQQKRAQSAESTNASDFARSADYMGSKRFLASFLVEAIAEVLPSHGTVVDLMCGAGSAASAFGKVWRTIASDAQQFCQALAIVQGAGYSRPQAEDLLERMLPIARDHANELCERLQDYLAREDEVFHDETDVSLLLKYQTFLRDVPTYSTTWDCNGGTDWHPQEEVRKRQRDATMRPYCLFTAYFANIYFGLRQCIEIDSLRFAIEQIHDAYEKQWALGALIATLSKIGTTYAAHFAQPLIRRAEDLTMANLSRVLEMRAASVMHEFSIRLLNLSEESEKAPRRIEVVRGPWSDALSTIDIQSNGGPYLAYLDAPYKREEYSRYYHILETLVTYSYPSSHGIGRTPDKSTAIGNTPDANRGERFNSEFFTKNKTRVSDHFVTVLTKILTRGWMCAWSYSDSGDADITSVIEQVTQNVSCSVKSVATPYTHVSHRGKPRKQVTEYLIVFIPNTDK